MSHDISLPIFHPNEFFYMHGVKFRDSTARNFHRNFNENFDFFFFLFFAIRSGLVQ